MSAHEVLLALASDQQTLAGLPKDSPLHAHLPLAQAAIEAYCQGLEAKMQEALQAIPNRSPYWDLRFLLGALAVLPERIDEGRRLLAKIPSNSPFAGPAQAVAAALDGEREVREARARSKN